MDDFATEEGISPVLGADRKRRDSTVLALRSMQ